MTAQTTSLPAVAEADLLAAEQNQIKERRKQLHQSGDRPSLGLALSGGGIRSGTFNLGIIQGIARSGVLPCVDYLSSVSGGGYTGTWLHTLIKRRGNGYPQEITEFLERPDARPHAEQKDPISFLRKFSSYLAPDVGLFSADTWVILVIWIWNILLNQLILIPFLACLCLLVFLLACTSHWYARSADLFWPVGELALAVILFVWGIRRAGKGVATTTPRADCPPPPCPDQPPEPPAPPQPPSPLDSITNAIICAVLVLAACLSLAAAGGGLDTESGKNIGAWWPVVPAAAGTLLGLGFRGLQLKGNFKPCYKRRHYGRAPSWPLLNLLAFIPGLATGFLFFGVAKLAAPWSAAQAVAWATPLFAMATLSGIAIHIGLMGADYPDNSREWLARVGAFLAIFAFGWAACFAIAIFGPGWMAKLGVWSWKTVAGLGVGWALTSLGGALAGTSAKTGGAPNSRKAPAPFQVVIAVAPSVFVVGYLLLISLGLHQGIAAICGTPAVLAKNTGANDLTVLSARVEGNAIAHFDVKSGAGATAPVWLQTVAATEGALFADSDSGCGCLWAVVFIGIGGFLVWLLPKRIDINEFSMHHFYKNRLVRCYLGATRTARAPSRLTGFDVCDDLPLYEFLPVPLDPPSGPKPCPYYGPFPLINTCLNLNTGSELGRRERKGTSFVFTPLYSGFSPALTDEEVREQQMDLRAIRRESFYVRGDKATRGGHRLTLGYGHPKGPTLGSCMAISGAAANPNGGYHTSPPLAFLMTMLDVRLGWWVGNPRLDSRSKDPGPRHALLALLSELFAQTNARSNFLNLSDGGHFENLGLYELVRRRCKYIIAGDGEQDGDYHFESLGGAVRKCRADFGVEIDIDPRRIHPAGDGLSRTHCVVGRIHYPETIREKGSEGWLLYLKASLTGDEPEDVAQYKSSHADFPQQTTANQFFTESQFESYRKLGLHVWESAVQNLDPKNFTCDRLDAFFECLYRDWYPPTNIAA